MVIVDDVVTTGTSVAEVRDLVRHYGGTVVAVACVVNRGEITAEDLNIPVFNYVVGLPLESFGAQDCLLCQRRVPIVTDVGHGEAFQQENPHYAGGYKQLAV